MAQATFSVRMDENVKKQLDDLCADFGMTTSTAINVFAHAVIRERRIPFEIVSSSNDCTREGAIEVMKAMRRETVQNGNCDMSLEDINAEINAVRKQK